MAANGEGDDERGADRVTVNVGALAFEKEDVDGDTPRRRLEIVEALIDGCAT